MTTNPDTSGRDYSLLPARTDPSMSTDSRTSADGSPQWLVRFTWKVISGLPHPKYTYSTRESESRAIDSATYMINNYDQRGAVRLVEAHVKGPNNEWVKVGETSMEPSDPGTSRA